MIGGRGMNNYEELIYKYLFKQWKRTLLTMTGIILAITLITSVTIIGNSIKQTQINQEKEISGDYHARIKNINSEERKILENHIKIEKTGLESVLGIHHLEKQDIDMIIYVNNQKAREQLGIKIKKGKMPEEKNEIALEEWVISKLNWDPLLGEEVSLDVIRKIQNEEGKGESYKFKEQFILVGIIKNTPLKMTQRTMALVSQKTMENILPNNFQRFNALLTINNEYPIKKTITELQKTLNITEDRISYNTNLLKTLGEAGKPNWVLIFLALIIITAAIAVVYNAVHISVLERIRQFGMLRSLGASPWQIKKIVLGEALILGITGIPLGLILGIFTGTGLIKVSPLLQDLITEISLPLIQILGIGLLGLTSVLVSFYNPARIAGKVSPLVAIRNNNQVLKDNSKKNKWIAGFIQSLNGITGKMAYQNLWRNPKRFLITVFSLSLGVILLIVFGYFVENMDVSNMLENILEDDYVLRTEMTSKQNFSEENVDTLKNLEGVLEISKLQRSFGHISMSEKEMSLAYKDIFLQGEYNVRQNPETNKYNIPLDILGLTSESLEETKKYLQQGKIDLEKLSNEPVILVNNNFYSSSSQKRIESDFKIGDEIEINQIYMENGDIKYKTQKFVVGGIVTKIPEILDFRINGPTVYLHQNSYKKYFDTRGYKKIGLKISAAANIENIEKEIQNIVDQIPHASYLSYQEELEENQKQKNQTMALLLGLIIVISIIGVFNIINTISTNLILRTQEFGTLRAIGMTMSQLKKMIRFEGVLYGLVSAFWGSIIGTGLSFILYKIMGNYLEYLTWSLPWEVIILACSGSIVMGLLATIIPMKRLANLSVVDSIQTIE